MITPKLFPDYFRTEQVGPWQYFVPTYISVGLSEDLQDAYEEAYRTSRPGELVDDTVDPTKYVNWLVSKEGKRLTSRAAAARLFIPSTPDTPAMDGEPYYLLTSDQLDRALTFSKPPSIGNEGGQLPSTQNGEGAPATATTTGQ